MWSGGAGLLTTVGALLIIGDNVLMALRLEPATDAECSLDAADEVGVLVGVLPGLVEHPDDLLAACRRLQNKRRIQSVRAIDRTAPASEIQGTSNPSDVN